MKEKRKENVRNIKGNERKRKKNDKKWEEIEWKSQERKETKGKFIK